MTPSPSTSTRASTSAVSDAANDRAIAVHDEQAKLFRGHYEALGAGAEYDSAFNYGRARLQEIMDRWIPLPAIGSHRALLDLGCGTGHHLRRWSEAGYACSGLDAAAEMVAEARGRNPELRVEQGSVYGLPFPDGSFDIVVSIEVLRYLSDVPAALREVRRVLRPGGHFIATITSPLSLTGYPLLNRVTGRLPIPGFVNLPQHFHSVRQMRQMLEATQLTCEDMVGAAFVTAPQKIAERLAPPLFAWSLRLFEGVDRLLSRQRGLADLSMHVLLRASRRE